MCLLLYQGLGEGMTELRAHHAYLERPFEEVVALDGLGMFVRKEVWEGYPFDEVMASGSFTQGSTIELSADAPVKEPYTLYMQGGLSIEYGKLSILLALTQMKNK